MEPAVDREFTALGGLFQHIITDLKNSAPVWEDFLVKASKLHSQLKATILSSTSFLDSFQKIADMATNTRGATKEIGSALTRLCLRQRSVEARLKTFSNSLQESLVLPLQEKLEEWKKMANYLDKEHAKEFKKVRQDLKKKSSDTLRLQKKVRKVGVYDIKRTLDYALQDVTDKYLLLEETEKQSVRKALIEERSHFCVFVGYLQPVLEAELTMLHEINHLQEIVDTLSQITGDPHLLPSTSEQVISDVKSSENTWSFQTPPSSPGSLGSRKSSVCSISSINSSSSGSLKSSHSKQLSHLQPKFGVLQLASVSSQDSGFTSQDTLFMSNIMSPLEISHQLSTFVEMGSTTSSTPSSPLPSVTSTWPNLQDTVQYEKQPSTLLKFQRPHTISSAYEKNNHCRPALTAHTFQPLDVDCKSDSDMGTCTFRGKDHRNYNSQPGTPIYTRPIIPGRNEALKKKPSLPEKSPSVKAKHSLVLTQHTSNKSVPDFNRTPADQVVPHPIYANARELINNKESRHEENPYSLGNNRELQTQKELAAVLKEGLQCLKLGNDNLSPSPPNVPARLKLGRPACGGSETLPRSRGSFCEEDILQWQMSSMASAYCNNRSDLYDVHRRPMSIAGISAELLVPPRKASTLQRVGSSGYKPPTPVRRSSSITTPTSQTRASNENLSIKRSDSSFNSGAGEVRYSPNFTELSKNSNSVSHSASPPEKSLTFRHVVDKNRRDCQNSPDSYPVNGRDTETENNIVTDVSDSRARLIQDLNCTLQQQRKLLERKSSFNEAPSVPPRHSSKQDRCEANNRSVRESCMAENTLYGTIGRHEEHRNHSGDKTGANRTFTKQVQRKNSMLELPSHRDSSWNSKEAPPHVPQRHSSQFSAPVKLSTPPYQEHHSDDKSIKHCFMAALNAKLAQQQNTKAEDETCSPHWQNRNNKNLISNHWPPGNTHYSESLMDQIKRGTTLRKVACNDRSAPRLA